MISDSAIRSAVGLVAASFFQAVDDGLTMGSRCLLVYVLDPMQEASETEPPIVAHYDVIGDKSDFSEAARQVAFEEATISWRNKCDSSKAPVTRSPHVHPGGAAYMDGLVVSCGGGFAPMNEGFAQSIAAMCKALALAHGEL